MLTDIAACEKLLHQLPFSNIEQLYKQAQTAKYNAILHKFDKWLSTLTLAVKITCFDYHLHILKDCKYDDCYQHFIRFKLTENVGIRIDMEDDRYFHSIAIYLCHSYGPYIAHWVIENQWAEAENGDDQIRAKQLTFKMNYYKKHIPENLDIDLQSVCDFCQYLSGMPLGRITNEDFIKSQQTSPIGAIIRKLYSLHYEHIQTPTHYVKQAMYTFLAIHKFRDSIVATLPKDIVKLIAIEIWNTKDDTAWTTHKN